MPDELTPSTNIEKFLAKTAGESVELPEPATRIEKYLNKIASEQTITEATDNWLDEHIDPSTGYVLDNTLTLDNAAPPASAVGDLKSAFGAYLNNNVVTIHLEDLEMESKGWIGDTGAFTGTTNGSHKIVKMDASYLRYVAFQSNVAAANIRYARLDDVNGNTKKIFPALSTNKQEFELSPENGDVLYITFINGQKASQTDRDAYYSTIEAKDYHEAPTLAYKQEIIDIVNDINNNDIKYHTCVKKPFDFSGKKLDFFGDSLTYGYIGASGGTPAHQATNQFPKLFSEAVGADSFNNAGVSGYSFSQISTLIQGANLGNWDFVFVAAGVNDWQTGVTGASLLSTLEDLCTYLSNNYTGEVIFITPINEAGRVPNVTPTQTLQNVRNVITRTALKYGYSVVQGWEFPFPTEYDDSTYVSLMFQDKLHPTELGYSMYAQALRNALC